MAVFLLLLVLWAALQTDWGQNWLARRVTGRLSRDLQTHVDIRHVRFHFFDKMDLEGVLVKDRKQDTLLYAGTVQVNITDWFFLKDTAELKYVGLSDAVIHFNRTDSVWNYNFLEKYFASTDTSTKKKAGISFDLKKVVMHHVIFVQKDAWTGSDFTASVNALDMDAHEISLSRKKINIARLDLESPYYATFNYKGKKPPDSSQVKKTSSPSEWEIVLQGVNLTNGRFRQDNQSRMAAAGVFDPEHLDFSGITGNLRNVGWAKDTIRGSLNIKAQERSGLVVKALRAATVFHAHAMIFDHLFLQTNHSTIGPYFSMTFRNGMKDFNHTVMMEAVFNKSSLSSEDLAFFIPATKDWKRVIGLNGKIKGTVDALNAKNLEIWAGDKTYINGNISVVGLPNIKETLINLEAKDLRATYADAVNLVPSLRKVTMPDLRRLQYIRFQGTYTGFINDFVTYGTIQTALGNLQTDLHMKFPEKGEPEYSGKLSTNGFELGQFLNNSQLGLVDFQGKLKGRGVDWKTLNLDIDGVIPRFGFGDYVYQNLTAKGRLSNRKFNGNFVMKDPNADVNLQGLIDFTGKSPLFDARATIARMDLKALHLSRDAVELNGNFDLNMQGSSLSDLLGHARITDATLLHNGQRLSFDSLVVSSDYRNGVKTLKATSNEFDATINGNFDLNSLPGAFTLLLNRYYPSYIKAPRNVKPQDFNFDITTGMVEDYIRLIDTSLSGFNNSHLTGSLNTTANTMSVDADIPSISYKQYSFSDIQVKGNGNQEKLVLHGQVNNAIVSENFNFPQTTFGVEAQNDVSEVSISTMANQTINRADLSAQIKTFADGLTVLFKPSSFVLNGKSWSIDQGGELNFRRNTVVQGQLVLKESNQEVQISTQPSAIGNWNDLHVALRNLNLGDISPFLLPHNQLEGLLQGDIVVEDPQNKFNVVTSLHTDELRLDNDSIGQVDLSAVYNNKSGMLTGRGNNLDPDHHIDFDLAMDLKDSAQVFTDRISLHPRNFQLKYLERFIGNLFTDIQGYLTGDIDILGEGSNRDYIAKARLKDAAFKVVFTQVSYKIEDTEIELKKDTIKLDGIKLRDRFGNLASLNGYIKHHSFQDMYFDLAVQSQSKQLELLNTTYSDNQQFYGRAKGSGSFVLVGPQKDMQMFIDIRASETDSSYITLPPSNTRQSGQAAFMVEKKYGKEMSPAALSGAATNLQYDITLTATPLVNMEVILDELTGDIIKGRGSGTLRIHSGTTEPLTINGHYNIDEGNYLFTFQSFFKKPFVLRPASNNYIEWNGDPYKAHINLVATYTAENVSFAPLATLLNAGTNSPDNQPARVRADVNVVATLTGELFQPAFNFKLEFPNRDIYRNQAIAFGIQQIEKNQNELNKQVTYLIVFNSFAPYENQTIGNPFGEAISSTLSGLLFGEVNKRLNELLSKVLQRNNLTLNFTGSLYNRSPITQNQTGLLQINQGDVNIAVGKSFLEGRVNFTITGTFDVPLQSDYQQSVRLFPDVTIELLLNKSGSVRASFFYRENVDYLSGTSTTGGLQTRRFGASLSYGREFDSFGHPAPGPKKKGRGKLKSAAPMNVPKQDAVDIKNQ
ncbi:MAG: translocation/assembly module TamB domain-containing protein [Flavisolibacter sp.]